MTLRILLVAMVVYLAVNLVRRAVARGLRRGSADPAAPRAARKRDLDRSDIQDADFKEMDGGPHAD